MKTFWETSRRKNSTTATSGFTIGFSCIETEGWSMFTFLAKKFIKNNRSFCNKVLRHPFTMYEPKNHRPPGSGRNIYHNRISDVEGISTVYKHPDVTYICEYIKGRFYFATLSNGRKEARNTPSIHFFTIDDELIYENFYNDFGPLNIACLYKYCCKVNKKLNSVADKHRQIVHYTSQREYKRANAAYLVASYAVLCLNQSPREAYNTLFMGGDVPLKKFQDASMGSSLYNIHMLDCLNGLQKAASFGFFNLDDFDLAEYEKLEDIRNGNINWMVPQKFLAFVGPSTEPGNPYHPPECYVDCFLKNGVVAVVRLSKKTYDAARFVDPGIAHYDMFMPDGTVPPRRILNQFLQLSENTSGPIAVHCKAGLGRTGTLIAAYLIKHYKMTAREAIAWIRICRPGSVIGHQQAWLENMEKNLLNAGHQYKLKYYDDGDMVLHHKRGIYSIADKMEKKILCSSEIGCTEPNKCEYLPLEKTNKMKLTRILGKLRIKGTQDSERESRQYESNEAAATTQGDKLNEIKMNRHKQLRSIEPRNSCIVHGVDRLKSPRKRK